MSVLFYMASCQKQNVLHLYLPKDFAFLTGSLVHPRKEQPSCYWVPRRETSEQQKEAEITEEITGNAAETATRR